MTGRECLERARELLGYSGRREGWDRENSDLYGLSVIGTVCDDLWDTEGEAPRPQSLEERVSLPAEKETAAVYGTAALLAEREGDAGQADFYMVLYRQKRGCARVARREDRLPAPSMN